MTSLKNLDQTLKKAAKLLDRAAKQIRDTPLLPNKKYIHSLGLSLGNISDIQHAIYKIEPKLMPEYLQKKSSKYDKLFTKVFIKSEKLIEIGEFKKAINIFQNILKKSLPKNYKKIAQNEILRIKSLENKKKHD